MNNRDDWLIGLIWRHKLPPVIHGYSMIDYETAIISALHTFMIGKTKLPKIKSELKNPTTSRYLLDTGNVSACDIPWQQTLEIYTRALMVAPPKSCELAQAYSSMSATCYIGELHHNACLNVHRAMEVGYPDELKPKLYMGLARSLYEINDGKQCPQIEEAMNNAKLWLNSIQISDANRTSTIDNIQEFNNCYQSTSTILQNNYDEASIIPKDNLFINEATAAIKIAYSNKYGRHIVATRDIQPGEILFSHRSYASIVYSKKLHLYCWYCSRRIFGGVPCNQCSTVLFCNESCRDYAWQEHHEMECLAIPAMLNAKMSAVELMSLRLLVKSVKEAGGCIKNLRKQLEKIESLSDPIARLDHENVFNNTKYASVFSLMRRHPILSVHAVKSVKILYILAATTDLFGRKVRNYADLFAMEGSIFLCGLLLRHIGICFNNSIEEVDQVQVMDPIRLQLNPLLSLFNHSCDPSVIVHTNGDLKLVIALKSIKVNRQIFGCYLPQFWEGPTARRKSFLSSVFNFDCQCRACLEDWREYIHKNPPSDESENYPQAVIEQWKRIINDYPIDNPMISANVTLFTKFFE